MTRPKVVVQLLTKLCRDPRVRNRPWPLSGPCQRGKPSPRGAGSGLRSHSKGVAMETWALVPHFWVVLLGGLRVRARESDHPSSNPGRL